MQIVNEKILKLQKHGFTSCVIRGVVHHLRSSLSPSALQPLEGPAGDDFHHDIARDIGQQVEAMILEAQPEIVFFEGCSGRIRHPERRVVSNMCGPTWDIMGCSRVT